MLLETDAIYSWERQKIIKSESGIIKTWLVYGTVLKGLGMSLLKEKP